MNGTEEMKPEPPGREQEAPPPPGRSRRLRAAIGIVLLALLFGASAAYFYIQREFDRPADPHKKETVLLRVRPGSTFNQIATQLEERGLLRKNTLFRLQARLRGGARRIHAGYYEFTPAMSPREIYHALTEGAVAKRSFTIPEGVNLREAARTMARSGFGDEKGILAAAQEEAFLKRLGIDKPSLEGYLFPATYNFPLGTPPRKILQVMVNTMRRRFDDKLRRRAAQLGFSTHEVLTLASIIEKETSVASERPLIAAVFMNRLRKNMRLQSDPTVIYSLPQFDGNIRKRDLKYDSPYNTYVYKGLPPGPIANPGLASIRAALYPADADYLYFVATKKGGHKFSRTYREHRRAIFRYQLRKRK